MHLFQLEQEINQEFNRKASKHTYFNGDICCNDPSRILSSASIRATVRCLCIINYKRFVVIFDTHSSLPCSRKVVSKVEHPVNLWLWITINRTIQSNSFRCSCCNIRRVFCENRKCCKMNLFVS